MKTETQLEEMFGGGPKLPPTHWMEKYAEASKLAANLSAENKQLRECFAKFVETTKQSVSISIATKAILEEYLQIIKGGSR